MVVALAVAHDVDLASFTAYLWQAGVAHRVVHRERQLILVPSDAEIEALQALFDAWCEDRLPPLASPRQSRQRTQQWLRAPLSLILMLASLVASVALGFGENLALLQNLSITPFSVRQDSILYTALYANIESLELWRFFTPVLMHFSVPHLVFNSLWVIVAGSVIERRQGRLFYIALILFCAVSSNVAQYYATGPVFGGLSGIVYALISYCWLWDRLCTTPQRKLNAVSDGIFAFMLIWLVLGFTGLLASLGLGKIANMAHSAGLITGLLCAALHVKLKAEK
ncbi:MAG: rhomboid family intramembrane serine protease [Pseudomonadales bacterium]